jgi:hypothetical protein
LGGHRKARYLIGIYIRFVLEGLGLEERDMAKAIKQEWKQNYIPEAMELIAKRASAKTPSSNGSNFFQSTRSRWFQSGSKS